MTDRVIGCLIGGALGDALGAHVEFLAWPDIESRFGPSGITELERTYGRYGAVTDDTQMTVFTVESAIRWHVAWRAGVPVEFGSAMWDGYLRWLQTQDGPDPTESDGWLLQRPWLHARRAPGNTNLQALRGGVMGRLDAPINNSRGCGAVMRSAPLGFFASSPDEAFERGAQSGVVTHSDPGGYLPAGILAAAVYLVAHGMPIHEALAEAGVIAQTWAGSRPTLKRLEHGLEVGRQGLPTPGAIHEIGEGWQGHDALAIAAACAASGAPLLDVLRAAANHSGDSDSTASIAGQLVGARDGLDDAATQWANNIEGRTDLLALADDFVTEFSDAVDPKPIASPGSSWWLRYPGTASPS